MEKHILKQFDQTFHQLLEREYIVLKILRIPVGVLGTQTTPILSKTNLFNIPEETWTQPH